MAPREPCGCRETTTSASDHLINDRFDHAAEIFSRMAQADGDAAEIQFALGSLFRRRGEVDRAIAIHSRLREHGAAVLRDKAAFALALDYLSAGLMDRAERLLEELAASREYRNAALDHLLRSTEQQGDWANALKIFTTCRRPCSSSAQQVVQCGRLRYSRDAANSSSSRSARSMSPALQVVQGKGNAACPAVPRHRARASVNEWQSRDQLRRACETGCPGRNWISAASPSACAMREKDLGRMVEAIIDQMVEADVVVSRQPHVRAAPLRRPSTQAAMPTDTKASASRMGGSSITRRR